MGVRKTLDVTSIGTLGGISGMAWRTETNGIPAVSRAESQDNGLTVLRKPSISRDLRQMKAVYMQAAFQFCRLNGSWRSIVT